MYCKKCLLLIFCIGFYFSSLRSQDQAHHFGTFNVMVVPLHSNISLGAQEEYTQNQNIAIHELNNVLKGKGFSNLLDYSTYTSLAKERTLLSNEQTLSSIAKAAIQNAPVDVIIEIEVTYINPPNLPQNKQVLINLKAIDRYNSHIYAIGSFGSKQRNFPSIQKAIQTTFSIDGVQTLNSFIEKLQYELDDVVKNGRLIKLKFEIAKESAKRFSNKIGTSSIADQIENFVKNQIAQGYCQLIGQSADYMDFSLKINALDSQSQPNTLVSIRRSLDGLFQKMGVEVKDIFTVGTWINCIVK